MAAPKAKRKKPVPRKRAPKTIGLEARDCALEVGDELKSLAGQVEREGGLVLAAYRDPLGGHSLLMAILPIDRVQPTPFQRDLSEAHHKRLADVINKTGRYLDPVIAVPAPDSGFWTPNGLHGWRRCGALG